MSEFEEHYGLFFCKECNMNRKGTYWQRKGSEPVCGCRYDEYRRKVQNERQTDQENVLNDESSN